jgi:peptidoglycan hydrolase-like protein with peptidoglycan-binding domain
MKQRFSFLTLLLLVSAAFIPSHIFADSGTSSLPPAAQALMQALEPPVPTASVPLQASTTAAQALLQALTPSAPIAPTSANVPPAARAVAATFTRPLVVGAHGSDVTALQQILKSHGYLSGNGTGYFGSLTVAALKQLQTAHGIQPLGSVGPQTRAVLNSLSSTATDRAALIASLLVQVKALQAQIAALLAARQATSTPQVSGSGGGGSTAGSAAIITNYTPPVSSGAAVELEEVVPLAAVQRRRHPPSQSRVRSSIFLRVRAK